MSSSEWELNGGALVLIAFVIIAFVVAIIGDSAVRIAEVFGGCG